MNKRWILWCVLLLKSAEPVDKQGKNLNNTCSVAPYCPHFRIEVALRKVPESRSSKLLFHVMC